MIIGVILAAGSGTRLGLNTPKSLIKINNKEIITYPLNTFLKSNIFNKIYIACHPRHIYEYKKIVNKFKNKNSININIELVAGSLKGRQESLKKIVNSIKKNDSIKPNDLIVTHDGARINITKQTILDNINLAKKYGYSSTVIKANDSIFSLDANKYIPRKNVYLIQTPQTFQYKFWKNKPSKDSTDLFSYLGIKLKKENLSFGSIINYKITEKDDLIITKQIQKNLLHNL